MSYFNSKFEGKCHTGLRFLPIGYNGWGTFFVGQQLPHVRLLQPDACDADLHAEQIRLIPTCYYLSNLGSFSIVLGSIIIKFHYDQCLYDSWHDIDHYIWESI